MSNEHHETIPASRSGIWYNPITRRFEGDQPFAVIVEPVGGTAQTFVAEQGSSGLWQTAQPVAWNAGDRLELSSMATRAREALIRAWDWGTRGAPPGRLLNPFEFEIRAPASEDAIRARIAEASHAPHRVDVQFEADRHGSMVVRVFGARMEDEAAIEAAVQQETPLGCSARVEFLRLADLYR